MRFDNARAEIPSEWAHDYRPRIDEVHSRLLGYGDFVNLGEASRLLDIGYQTVSAAIEVGHGRGWYETRESATKRNPRTGRPAVEYRALPKTN